MLVNLQQEAYPDFDDIQENFLIATDGTVYEGRGFGREGQTTYEDSLTSFNTQAVSISFLVAESDEKPNLKQLETFCFFIEESIDDEKLSRNFKAFQRFTLISSYFDAPNLNEDFETCDGKLTWESRKFENV